MINLGICKIIRREMIKLIVFLFIFSVALNLAVFLLIGKTSALTMNVAGVIKDWLLIGLSVLIFRYLSVVNLYYYCYISSI